MDNYSTTTEAMLGQSFFSRAFEFSNKATFLRVDTNNSHCNEVRPKNSTIVVIIPGGYEGIPQNLLINFVAWMVNDFKDFSAPN
jgi:hypothetical protein